MTSANFMDGVLGSNPNSQLPNSPLTGYSNRMYPYVSLSPAAQSSISGNLYYSSSAASDFAKSCRYNSTGQPEGPYSFPGAPPGSTPTMMTPSQFFSHPGSTDLGSSITQCNQLGMRQLDPIPDVPRYPWMSIAGMLVYRCWYSLF